MASFFCWECPLCERAYRIVTAEPPFLRGSCKHDVCRDCISKLGDDASVRCPISGCPRGVFDAGARLLQGERERRSEVIDSCNDEEDGLEDLGDVVADVAIKAEEAEECSLRSHESLVKAEQCSSNISVKKEELTMDEYHCDTDDEHEFRCADAEGYSRLAVSISSEHAGNSAESVGSVECGATSADGDRKMFNDLHGSDEGSCAVGFEDEHVGEESRLARERTMLGASHSIERDGCALGIRDDSNRKFEDDCDYESKFYGVSSLDQAEEESCVCSNGVKESSSNTALVPQSCLITREQLHCLTGGARGGFKNPLGVGTPMGFCGGRALATSKGKVHHICVKEKINHPLPRFIDEEFLLYRIAKSCGPLVRDVQLLLDILHHHPPIPIFWEPKDQKGTKVTYVGHWKVASIEDFSRDPIIHMEKPRSALVRFAFANFDQRWAWIIRHCQEKSNEEIKSIDWDSIEDENIHFRVLNCGLDGGAACAEAAVANAGVAKAFDAPLVCQRKETSSNAYGEYVSRFDPNPTERDPDHLALTSRQSKRKRTLLTDQAKALSYMSSNSIDESSSSTTLVPQSCLITYEQLHCLTGGTRGRFKNALGVGKPMGFNGGRAFAISDGYVQHICIKEKVNHPLPQSIDEEFLLFRIAKPSGQLPIDIKRLMNSHYHPPIPIFWQPKDQKGTKVTYIGHWEVVSTEDFSRDPIFYIGEPRCALVRLTFAFFDRRWAWIIRLCHKKSNEEIKSIDWDAMEDEGVHFQVLNRCLDGGAACAEAEVAEPAVVKAFDAPLSCHRKRKSSNASEKYVSSVDPNPTERDHNS